MMLALLAAMTGQPATGGDSVTMAGRCDYSDRVVRSRAETVLVACDRLTMADRDGRTWFDFQRAVWGPTLRVGGLMDGGTMIVDAIVIRSGKAVPATGTCKRFVAGNRLTVVSCLVKAGGGTYATNFRPSRQ